MSTRVDRAELPSLASCFRSVSRPKNSPSSPAQVALCFLLPPHHPSWPAPPSPRGRLPLPPLGFYPGGCGFLSHLGSCVLAGAPPPRCRPFLTTFPLSSLAPVLGLVLEPNFCALVPLYLTRRHSSILLLFIPKVFGVS